MTYAGAADRIEENSQHQPSQHEYPYSKSEFFRRPLPAEVIVGLVANLAAERVPGESRELDFTPWGGAYNRVRDDATALVNRRERPPQHRPS